MCVICGHVYDEELGDPAQEIAPGTAFQDLGDRWHCPICAEDTTHFVPLEMP